MSEGFLCERVLDAASSNAPIEIIMQASSSSLQGHELWAYCNKGMVLLVKSHLSQDGYTTIDESLTLQVNHHSRMFKEIQLQQLFLPMLQQVCTQMQIVYLRLQYIIMVHGNIVAIHPSMVLSLLLIS